VSPTTEAPSTGRIPGPPSGLGARDPRIAFILRLGRSLHAHGYPAHRLEVTLDQIARRLGLDAQFFSQPTSIFAAFGPQERQQTFLMRVEPGDVQLERLAELDGVARAVAGGSLEPEAGLERVGHIESAAPRYSPRLTAIAFALTSGAAARFLGGGSREVGWAAAIGLAVGVLSWLASRWTALRRLFEPLAAFLAAVIAAGLAAWSGPGSVFVATLAGIIVLIPGLTLATAMIELGTRHLASGTARLSGALVVFLGITVGVAVGDHVGASVFGSAPVADPIPLPDWTELIALVVAPVSFTVLLRAAPRDLPWIVLGSALSFVGGRWGAAALGPELGIMVGSLTAGLASNAYARTLHRPSAATLVPSLLILVPGSIGFRSLAQLMDREVLLGVETAFRTVIMFSALAAGVLLANVVMPVRQEAGSVD
jgi:uncharacterized membrane protein YjjP (DUF1212 family)